MTRRLLQLPARKLTGCPSFAYTTAAQTWAGKLPKAADVDLLPVAWTPYQQSIYAGDSLPSIEYFKPARWYATVNCPVRLPRLVMFEMTNLGGLDVVDPDVLFDAGLKADMTAGKVAAFRCKTPYESAYRNAFRMFLPHEAETTVNDTSAGLGTISNTLPAVTAANWIAGDVLYLDLIANLDAATGVYSDNATGTYSHYDNIIAAHVNQVKNSFARYNKFGYHVAYCSQYANAYRDLARDLVADIFNVQLAGYNCTVDYQTAAFNTVTAAVYATMRSKIRSFFNL